MKNKLAVIAALCALICLITASAQVIESARYALSLCAELILPSLFPFFVLCGLLSRLGLPAYLGRLLSPAAARLFRVSGAGASALFVGLTGGYPMGAAYIADMHRDGLISAHEAEQLLAFCNNSGPAFIMGAVGVGVFGSIKIGLLLYLAHILSAVAVGIILRGKGENTPAADPIPASTPQSLSQALPDAVRQAVISSLNVCGFVVCFTVFVGLLDAGGFFSTVSGYLSSTLGMELHWSRARLTGSLELGSGTGAMRGLSAAPSSLALAAAILGWGGVSVQFQTMSVLADAEIKCALHLAGRIMSACFGAVFAYLLACLF